MVAIYRIVNGLVFVGVLLALCSAVDSVFATPTTCPSTISCLKGAPGPIAGAGLPVLAIGYGVYWLVRRRLRHKPD